MSNNNVLTRAYYATEMGKLLRANNGDENAPEVIALNNRYMTQLNVQNAGPEIDASNQATQGSTDTRYVSGNGLSDSQINELKWVADRKEENDALDTLASEIVDIKNDYGML